MPLALLADDDDRRRGCIRSVLAASLTVREFQRLNALPDAYRSLTPDAVLIGASPATLDESLAIVGVIRQLDRNVPVLVVMEHGSEQSATASLRAGVTDYLPYDSPGEDLLTGVERCLRLHRSSERGSANRLPCMLLGSTGPMQHVYEYLKRVAIGDSNVLITGETGTGKELAAATVHQFSPRRQGPFIPIVCAAIPDALFESELFGYEKGAFTGATAARAGLLQSAQNGTVFLDEVGDIGLPIQAKLLRVLESREVYRVGGRVPLSLDVRVVAATHHDLEKAVEQGTFRKDLYYRLNVARVHLPPLRERRGDIGQILDHYVRQFNNRSRTALALSTEVTHALEAYDWPGNVRELKNLVESLFVCPGDRPIHIDDLPVLFRRKLEAFCRLEQGERRELLDALFAARWNKSRAAQLLKCSRMTLYRRMAKCSVIASDNPALRSAPKA